MWPDIFVSTLRTELHCNCYISSLDTKRLLFLIYIHFRLFIGFARTTIINNVLILLLCLQLVVHVRLFSQEHSSCLWYPPSCHQVRVCRPSGTPSGLPLQEPAARECAPDYEMGVPLLQQQHVSISTSVRGWYHVSRGRPPSTIPRHSSSTSVRSHLRAWFKQQKLPFGRRVSQVTRCQGRRSTRVWRSRGTVNSSVILGAE